MTVACRWKITFTGVRVDDKLGGLTVVVLERGNDILDQGHGSEDEVIRGK